MMTLDEMVMQAKSKDFKRLVNRAQSENLPIRTLEEAMPTFEKWITAAVQRIEERIKSRVSKPSDEAIRIISGEFNHQYWNLLDADFWQRCKALGISIWAICCPYYSVPSEGSGAEPLNHTFGFFQAHSRPNSSIRLYQSGYRLPCHWVFVGDEIHATDWHQPCLENTPERYENTVIIRQEENPRLVRDFAFAEFRHILSQFQIPPFTQDVDPSNATKSASCFEGHGGSEVHPCNSTEELDRFLDSFDPDSPLAPVAREIVYSDELIDRIPCMNRDKPSDGLAFEKLEDTTILQRFKEGDLVLNAH